MANHFLLSLPVLIVSLIIKVVPDTPFGMHVSGLAGIGLDLLTQSPDMYIHCTHITGIIRTPVSYTHLDVYKRQPTPRLLGFSGVYSYFSSSYAPSSRFPRDLFLLFFLSPPGFLASSGLILTFLPLMPQLPRTPTAYFLLRYPFSRFP